MNSVRARKSLLPSAAEEALMQRQLATTRDGTSTSEREEVS